MKTESVMTKKTCVLGSVVVYSANMLPTAAGRAVRDISISSAVFAGFLGVTRARKTTHCLDGQHQDVDRTRRGRVNQNNRGQR